MKGFSEEFLEQNQIELEDTNEYQKCLMERSKNLLDTEYIQKQRELTIDGAMSAMISKTNSLGDLHDITYF